MGYKFHHMYKLINVRTDIQIRERYCNVLDPTINYKQWNNND